MIGISIFGLQLAGIQISGGTMGDMSYKPAVETPLFYPKLVDQFYQFRGHEPGWMLPGDAGRELRKELVDYMNYAYRMGLVEKKYHIEIIQSFLQATLPDTAMLVQADRIYTDAAIALCKDIYGYKLTPWLGYDQLSAKYAEAIDTDLLQRLVKALQPGQLAPFFHSLEPAHPDYLHLKNELERQLIKEHKDTVAMLVRSMNYYRWIHHFRFDKFIVINLPEARLRYYENDSALLDMKIVVGKTATPTPRFATVCDQAILYPYWYVPRSITFNEYLPKIKKNPGWIDANNMQVIDGSGRVMDHYKMNWSAFHAGYFPYTIRQSTGCDNALGVIKFNIITPYGVYLHDTNNKTAFLSNLRFYSHGCIRIEEPLELGNKLLENKLDTSYLQSCFKEQKPKFIQLIKPVPVFSVYMQAVAGLHGKIRYYKDVYKLAQ